MGKHAGQPPQMKMKVKSSVKSNKSNTSNSKSSIVTKIPTLKLNKK